MKNLDEDAIACALRERLAAILEPYGHGRDGPNGFPALIRAEADDILKMQVSRRDLAESAAAYRRKAADQEAIALIALEALEAVDALRGGGLTEDIRSALGAQANFAREHKARLDEVRDAQIRRAILEVAEGSELVASRKFAESIVGGVKARLGDVRGTSAASIERAISRILLERRDQHAAV
jgi:hypothetical protein